MFVGSRGGEYARLALSTEHEQSREARNESRVSVEVGCVNYEKVGELTVFIRRMLARCPAACVCSWRGHMEVLL